MKCCSFSRPSQPILCNFGGESKSLEAALAVLDAEVQTPTSNPSRARLLFRITRIRSQDSLSLASQ